MPCSGGWPIHREFLLNCHAQSKRNMSGESVQEGTKCPSHALLSIRGFPWKSSFCSWGMESVKTQGLNPFTRVLSKNLAWPRQSTEALEHFLGQSQSHGHLCFLGMPLFKRRPWSQCQGSTFSLHSGSPAFSERPPIFPSFSEASFSH